MTSHGFVPQGYDISAMETFNLDLASAKEFLEVYKGRNCKLNVKLVAGIDVVAWGLCRPTAGVVPEYIDMAEELTEGPVLAMEVRAENAVETFRKTAGPWDIEIAKEIRPGTLRAMFGKDRVRNAVHCTDLPEDGMLECRYFFEILRV
jgi:nucleoside-diphosphate kinase